MPNPQANRLDGFLNEFYQDLWHIEYDEAYFGERSRHRKNRIEEAKAAIHQLLEERAISELQAVCGNKASIMTVFDYGNAITVENRIKQLQTNLASKGKGSTS